MPGRQYKGGGSHHYQQQYQNNPKMARGGHPNGADLDCSNSGNNGAPDRRWTAQQRRAGQGGYRKWVIESYLADDENFPSFQAQLVKLNLQLRDIPPDGNCLFRALGDQLEGHCRNHFRFRTEVVQYMRSHRTDFEPFVEDDMSFDDHMLNLQKLGTHAGNDAIVAFAKLHTSNVVIHQLNGKPLLIQGPATSTQLTRQLHIAYHNGDHYSSVRRKGDNTESPAQIRLDDAFSEESAYGPKTFKQGYDGVVSAKRDLEDIEAEVQIATNCQDMSRVRESLLECDYDVDAAIADLLQQMELTNGSDVDQQPSTTTPSSSSSSAQNNNNNNNENAAVANGLQANGVELTSTATTTAVSSSNGGRGVTSPGSVLKVNGHGSVGSKGHKVHFREDSIGNSSGYGSMNSKDGGARPKSSGKRSKEEKKLEKKRRAEEARRQKFLQAKGEYNNNLPQHTDIRDVTVVAMRDKKFTHI